MLGLQQGLGEVEVAVDLRGMRTRLRQRRQPAVDRVASLPAEVESAEEPDRRGARPRRGGEVAVEVAILRLHPVEESRDAVNGGRRHRHAGEARALECRELPSRHGGVAGLPGQVPPASAVQILRGDDEPDGLGERFLERLVPGHAERLGEGERGDAMPVHRALRQVAAPRGRLYPAEQVVQPSVDRLAVTALEVRVTGPEKGKQRETRGGRRARDRSSVPASPVTAASGEIELPRPVHGLVKGEPCEAPLHGGLAGRRPTTFGEEPAARAVPPIGEGISAARRGRTRRARFLRRRRTPR